MVEDLSELKKGDIILCEKTKRVYLCTRSEDIHIHRTELINLKDSKTELHEGIVGKPLVVQPDINRQPWEFKKISFDFAEDYLLDDIGIQHLKQWLERLGESKKFQKDMFSEEIE